ncbi:MAG: SDR family oxidoreductase [Candidatus Omnitrophota bacterium]
MNNSQVMLITGTSRGIGKFLAKHYVQRGFSVIGCSRQSVDYSLKNYRHFSLDICNEDDVREMFVEVTKSYKHLDVLINNVGIISMNYVYLTSAKTVRDIMDTNFIGTFICCREAIKIMQRNRSGKIINISSIAVPLSAAGTSAYSASKAAVEQLSKVLAKEVVSYGIAVNTLGLSFVEGSGMIKEVGEKAVKSALENTASKIPITFNDVAVAMDSLILGQNSTATGKISYLGGV